MRPSWDWEHGTGDVGSGTPGHSGHTGEVDPVDEDESFFQAGDEGRYEGGPATIDEEPLELVADEPVAVVTRTPEQDARRTRLVRVVAMAVGAFAALFAFGVVKQQKAGASEPPARVSTKVEAPQSSRRDVTPRTVAKAEPAEKAKPVVEAPVAAAPEPAPKKQSAVKSEWSAPVVAALSAPVAKPATTTSVTAIPQTKSTSSGGNVANFASRGPGTQQSTGPSTPTASFPVQ